MARFNKLKIKKLYLTSQDKTKGQLSKEVLVTASAEDLNSLVGAATSGTNGLLLAGAYTNGISITGTATNSISISGAATTGINITSATVKSINIANTVTTGTHGIYLKSTVTAFPGSEFIGAYIRAEAATNAATAKSLYGTIIYGTNNAVTQTTGSLWGTLTYAYIKGATAVTIANAYAGQFEISMDAGRSANATITTEAACLLAKVTAGDLADDTKVHGMIIRVGDMDGDSATFGNGILIEDDASMSGTCKFTTGINISSGCTTGINLSGANTTGINISGANTTAINISTAQTDETGYTKSAVFQHGSHGTAIAYGTQTDHLVLHSTHITAGATGKYVIGKHMRIDTSAASTGHFFCNKNYITIAHQAGAVRGIYNQIDITATALLNENVQCIKCGIDVTAGTITGVGKIVGLTVEVDVIAGATVANVIHGIEVDMRDIDVDVAGETIGIKVTMAGGSNYLDYGMQFSNCFDTATAVLDFDLTQGNTACGILMDSGAYTITTGVSFTGIYTTGISMTGTYGTGITLGTTGSHMILTADTNHAIDVFSTSPDAAGNHFANRFYHTNTAETTGGHFAMWVQNTVGAAGAGHGCMYIKLDCATFEAPTGGNSALNVEMVLPNCSHSGGSYHPFVIDVDASGPNLVMHGNAAIPCSFMKLEVYGADVAEWNTKASLFTLSGVAAVTDGMWEAEDVNDPDFTHTLRINISGTYYFIGLSTTKAFDA